MGLSRPEGKDVRLPLTFPRPALSAMGSVCEPSASIRDLSFGSSDPSLSTT